MEESEEPKIGLVKVDGREFKSVSSESGFRVTTSTPGQYEVGFFPRKKLDEIWEFNLDDTDQEDGFVMRIENETGCEELSIDKKTADYLIENLYRWYIKTFWRPYGTN